jgi:hypothetical protein
VADADLFWEKNIVGWWPIILTWLLQHFGLCIHDYLLCLVKFSSSFDTNLTWYPWLFALVKLSSSFDTNLNLTQLRYDRFKLMPECIQASVLILFDWLGFCDQARRVVGFWEMRMPLYAIYLCYYAQQHLVSTVATSANRTPTKMYNVGNNWNFLLIRNNGGKEMS